MPSPLHAHARKGLVKRVALPCPRGIIVAQNHGHTTFVECNYVRSVLTRMRLAYVHGTEVVVSFYFTHTGIANYLYRAVLL